MYLKIIGQADLGVIPYYKSPSKRPLASPLRLNTCEKALESAFDQVAAAHRLRSGRSGRASSASFQLILI